MTKNQSYNIKRKTQRAEKYYKKHNKQNTITTNRTRNNQ